MFGVLVVLRNGGKVLVLPHVGGPRAEPVADLSRENTTDQTITLLAVKVRSLHNKVAAEHRNIIFTVCMSQG